MAKLRAQAGGAPFCAVVRRQERTLEAAAGREVKVRDDEKVLPGFPTPLAQAVTPAQPWCAFSSQRPGPPTVAFSFLELMSE